MHPDSRLDPSPADLDLIERVARSVARAGGLHPREADDFTQSVHLRLAERGYDVLAKFEGRSSLRTYLTVVIARLLKDWRNHEYGKWRPCAAARRLGTLGEEIDRLQNRDGLSSEEVVQILATRMQAPEAVIRAAVDLVPRRASRQRVSLDAVPDCGVPFADPVVTRERERRQAARRAALARAVSDLPPHEVRLLVARVAGGTTIADLARRTNEDAKSLYRRLERLRRQLRARLEAEGVDAAVAAG
ncbi:MAG: sigma-70 family RNA polymerase sigma factor [Vicinamibacterales bacterium]